MRLFYYFGFAVLFFFVFLSIKVGCELYVLHSLNSSAETFAGKSLQVLILSNWSADVIEQRSSPELRAHTSTDQLEQVMAQCRQLGNFQNYDEPELNAHLSFKFMSASEMTAVYRVGASFQYGKIESTMLLIRHQNDWQIEGFHIDLRKNVTTNK